MYAEEAMTREEFRKARREQTLQEQRSRQRKIFIFCITLATVFVLGVGFGSLLARAEEPETESVQKYYTNICIQKGDTLWDIALEYMDHEHYKNRGEYIREVMRINHMTTDRLTAGEKLIVPYYAEQAGQH